MKFASIRIITADIQPLIAFYEQIMDLSVIQYTEDFAELHTSSIVLAIASTGTQELFGGSHLAAPASNQSVILEFRVDDVYAEYHKLADLLGNNIVQTPTTMPWGNRSMLFHDPDENLVNFFTPVTR